MSTSHLHYLSVYSAHKHTVYIRRHFELLLCNICSNLCIVSLFNKRILNIANINIFSKLYIYILELTDLQGLVGFASPFQSG